MKLDSFIEGILKHLDFWRLRKPDNRALVEIRAKIVVILVSIGLIFSIFVIANRIYFENKNKFIDILVKYEDWKEKEQLRNFGITAVSIQMDSLKSIEEDGRISVLSKGELESFKSGYPWTIGSKKFKSIKSSLNKTYIFSLDARLLNRLKNILAERFECVHNLNNDINYLEINAEKSEIYDLGIGFDSGKIKDLIKIGYKVVLRFKPDRLADEIWTKLIFESVDDWNNIFGIVFEGDEVFGFGTGSVDVLKTLLKNTNVRILSVEFAKVRGIDLFQRELADRVLRTHFIEEDRLKRISFYDAVYRFRRAVVERNIKVINLQPLPVSVEENMKFIKKVKEEFENRGYRLNNTRHISMDYFKVPNIFIFFIASSIIAVCLIIIPVYYVLILLIFLALIIILLVLNQTIFVQKFISFLGALCFPVIAVSFLSAEHKSRRFYDAFVQFIKITLITLTGSVLIGSLLSTEIFMKGITSFSGVKLANLFPLIFILFYFYVRENEKIGIILNRTMKVKHMIFISVLAIIFAIFLGFFISRTDNFGKVISGEDKIRLFLENVLMARPRIKEFLIGHPLLLLGITIYYRAKEEKLKLTSLLLITFGMIGQVSIINTFCHIHTPFIFSIFRTLNGILIGSISGLFLIIVWKFVYSRKKQ